MLSCSENDIVGIKSTENQQNISSNTSFRNLRSKKDIFQNISDTLQYPSDLLDYTAQDFQDIALNKSNKSIVKIKNIKGNTLDEIIEDVYSKYPSFDQFNSQAYKKIFPKLSTDEIQENKEIILECVEKMMAFDVSSAFSQLKGAKYALTDKKKKNARGTIMSSEWLNEACTVMVVVNNLRLDINGLWKSVDVANSQAGSKGIPTTNGGTNDYMDAVRHGVWGIFLGKYGTWRYSDPNKAAGIILQLLNAHECGQYSTDGGKSTLMDMHNNKIALNYYRSHVKITGSWLNHSTEISESDDTIASTIASYSVTLISNSLNLSDFAAEVNKNDNNTLVRYR